MGNGHVITHPPGGEGPSLDTPINRLLGGRFVYTDASTITLEVVRIDEWMYLDVSGGQDLTQIVKMFSNLTCDLTVSGAGGLHNDYAEAIDTPYVIYAAWDSTTEPSEDDPDNPADLVLFAVPSGTVVNAALVAALIGGGSYDFWSEPIGLMVNDGAGDLYEFSQKGLWFWFHDVNRGIPLVEGGTAVITTVVDMTTVVPDEAVRFSIYLLTENTNNTSRNCNIMSYNGAAYRSIFKPENIADLAGNVQSKENAMIYPLLNDPVNAMAYAWTGGATGGISMYIQGIQLYGG